jgi:hypothetical protein
MGPRPIIWDFGSLGIGKTTESRSDFGRIYLAHFYLQPDDVVRRSVALEVIVPLAAFVTTIEAGLLDRLIQRLVGLPNVFQTPPIE